MWAKVKSGHRAGVSLMQWELAERFEVIESLSGVCRELTRGDRELARKALGVHQKKTKRLTGRSLGVAKKLARNRSLPCLGAPSTHEWVKSVEPARA
ncbi:hypothetical protein GW17_00051532 [Ensete ventricosum]|nr:hypothetical protein GW17_00051532 [Ensete ventricosum]RZR77443.1 hypothetical protein BHM03_00002499 [Ensete ventricosum]